MRRALGIDFGGTKILGGVVDTNTGEVLSHAKKRTNAETGHVDTLDRLLTVVREAMEESVRGGRDIEAVGIGVAGQVDASKNRLALAPNLPVELLGSAIVDTVHRELGVPVSLFNDVAAAAAGEAAFGAGNGSTSFVCVFVGTGIGGAIYQDGTPYRGTTNTAGELGHTVVDVNGRVCGCGGRGHLEAYASRTAMVRSILGAMKSGRPSSLRQLVPNPDPADVAHVPIRSRALKDAMDAGDELTTEMLDEGAYYLAAGLSSIVNFYNPQRIVLGGGVVDAIDRFFQRAAHLTRLQALAVPRERVEIVKAALGDYSGIVGAAVLASGRISAAA